MSLFVWNVLCTTISSSSTVLKKTRTGAHLYLSSILHRLRHLFCLLSHSLLHSIQTGTPQWNFSIPPVIVSLSISLSSLYPLLSTATNTTSIIVGVTTATLHLAISAPRYYSSSDFTTKWNGACLTQVLYHIASAATCSTTHSVS